jgi:hypothetical protein
MFLLVAGRYKKREKKLTLLARAFGLFFLSHNYSGWSNWEC